jgi:hypothetical protein
MKSAIRLVCVAAVAFAVYWFGLRGGCGTRGAIACPDPALEQGVGVTVNAAAVEGIMVWDGHPLPLVIDTGKYTVRFWDVGVVWTQGLYNEAAVLAQVKAVAMHEQERDACPRIGAGLPYGRYAVYVAERSDGAVARAVYRKLQQYYRQILDQEPGGEQTHTDN